MGWRVLFVAVWVVSAVVFRLRGERFWRSIVKGLGVGVAFYVVAFVLLVVADAVG